MRSTKQLSITLPHKLAKIVRDKVASGEYASESEVVRDGLRSLTARDHVVERWLRLEVIPELQAIKSGRSKTVPVDKVKSRLSALFRRSG